MGKKRRKKKQTQTQTQTQTRLWSPKSFSVGTLVRGKPGTMDVDYADMPIGGWTGTIQEIDEQFNPKLCLVEWDQDTLDQIHPAHRQRCQRDELVVESMWLAEYELEFDVGKPAQIEQPTNFTSRSLSTDTEDDRIRAIFGLASGDPLPDVSAECLFEYHRYLETRLSFPFDAEYWVKTGPFREEKVKATVLDLLDADDCDEDQGVLCMAREMDDAIALVLAEIEAVGNRRNRQLIEDYAYWFHGSNRASRTIVPPAAAAAVKEPALPSTELRTILAGTLLLAIAGGIIGTALGSVLAAMEIVQVGTITGAVLVGLLGLWLGINYELSEDAVKRRKHRSLYTGIMWAGGGAVLGALAGALLMSILGVASGSLVGALLGKWVLRSVNRALCIALGAMAGAMLQAFYCNREQAMVGAIYGAVIGASLVAVFVLTIYGLAILLKRAQYRS
jgi:hypothetical protein